MRRLRERSIVAIDPTPRGVAFVFLENGRLLDWGERLAMREAEDVVRIVEGLLAGCAAEVLVIEDPDAEAGRRRPRIRQLLQSIAQYARRRGTAVVAVSRAEVQNAWGRRGATNKEAVAAAIGLRFPELSTIVPPPRRASRNEDSRVNVFDAASLVLHVLDPAVVGP